MVRKTPMYMGVVPYRMPGVRDVARRLKHPDRQAVWAAALTMARFIPAGALLIPVPDRWGDPRANLILCRALAELTGNPVLPALTRRRAVESCRERRKRGLGSIPPQDQEMVAVAGSAEVLARWPGPVVFVDNVVVTGATFAAARLALGRGRGLAFAWDAPSPSDFCDVDGSATFACR